MSKRDGEAVGYLVGFLLIGAAVYAIVKFIVDNILWILLGIGIIIALAIAILILSSKRKKNNLPYTQSPNDGKAFEALVADTLHKNFNEVIGDWGYFNRGTWFTEIEFEDNCVAYNGYNDPYNASWWYDMSSKIYKVKFSNILNDKYSHTRYFKFGHSKDTLIETDSNGAKEIHSFIRRS